MVRADYVSNAIALMVFVALVAAILLLGSITLELERATRVAAHFFSSSFRLMIRSHFCSCGVGLASSPAVSILTI